MSDAKYGLPPGFRMARSIMEVRDVRGAHHSDMPLLVQVRGAWTPARLDHGIGAQPTRRRADIPVGRQQVAVTYGEPPFGGRRRYAAEDIAIPTAASEPAPEAPAGPAEREATDEPGGRYQRMTYLDVAEPTGPAWSHFQLTRARDGAFSDPDRVPDYALRHQARDRVAEARVACEFLVSSHLRTGNVAALRTALREVEHFLSRERSGTEADVQEHVVAALFGAREIHERQERIAAGLPVDTHDHCTICPEWSAHRHFCDGTCHRNNDFGQCPDPTARKTAR